MTVTRDGEAAGIRPRAARRIVEFRARDDARAAAPSCNEHHPVGKERRGVMEACDVKTAGLCPGSGRWIVEFRACNGLAVVLSPSSCDKHHAVL